MKTKQIKTLYVVGKVINAMENQWEFVGIFDTKIRATAACIDEDYFIGPVILNEIAPVESVAWDGAYYPKLAINN